MDLERSIEKYMERKKKQSKINPNLRCGIELGKEYLYKGNKVKVIGFEQFTDPNETCLPWISRGEIQGHYPLVIISASPPAQPESLKEHFATKKILEGYENTYGYDWARIVDLEEVE